MPTIREKMLFNYNGVWSDAFGLIHISTSNDMFEDNFVAGRDIIESQIKGNDKPLFQGFQNNPLEFEMEIAFTDKFDSKKLDDVVNWLFADYYKPLYFKGEEGKVFYCMPVGDSRIVHNGLNQGYFMVTMRCDSPFVYSPVLLSEKFDLSVTTQKIVEIFNGGHFDIYPEISIQSIGSGNVSIQNMSDEGVLWEIRDLTNLENIYINCEKEIVETDIIGVHRYNNISGIRFPKLIHGKNVLKITGKCYIQFRYRYKYKF